MKFFILAAFAAVAFTAEVYPETKYQPAPAYSHSAHKSYEKNYDYAPRPYSFDYAVKDDYSYVDFNHNEYSDGKVVSGTYRVVLPDSRVQIVTYKDEGYGLVADVKYEGTAQYPEYKPSYKPSYPTTYQQDKPAYNPSKPVHEQPQVAYEQPKPVYDGTKYQAQPVQRPVYNPAPAAYKPSAYKTKPAAYKPTPAAYQATPAKYAVKPAPYTALEYPASAKY